MNNNIILEENHIATLLSITPGKDNDNVIHLLKNLYKKKKITCDNIAEHITNSYNDISIKLISIQDEIYYELLYLIWVFIKIIFMLINIKNICDNDTVYNYINTNILQNIIKIDCDRINTSKNMETRSKNKFGISTILPNIKEKLNYIIKNCNENEILEIDILTKIITMLNLQDINISEKICIYKKKYEYNIGALLNKSLPPVSSNKPNITPSVSSMYKNLKIVTGFNQDTHNRNRGESNPEPVNKDIQLHLPKKASSWTFPNSKKGGKKKSRRYRTKKNRKRKTRRV